MTTKSRLIAAERVAGRLAAQRRSDLDRSPIASEDELVRAIEEARQDGRYEAVLETLWQRLTPDVADAFEEAIRAESIRRGEAVDW